MKSTLWFCMMSIFAVFELTAQDTSRFTQGSLAGFTKSPTEHVINQIDKPFEVRSVNGFIDLGNQQPVQRVLFEVRGPGDSRQIRQALTDQHGKFKVGRVPPGTYNFKATLNGFQSVVGSVIVTRKATKTTSTKISMRVGV